jgi:alpha-amylase
VVNSLRRRPEPYHAKLREAQRGGHGAESIHDRVVSKEQGLENYLHYDRYNRHAFRSMVFGAGRSLDEYRQGRLEESAEMAGGRFQIASAAGDRCLLEHKAADCPCEATSQIVVRGNSIEARWRLRNSGLAELKGGLELVLNLLAPAARDRYFILPDAGQRQRLGWSGEARGEAVALVDEWLDLRIDARVSPAAVWWIYPIYTVSQSEAGFEKVYQGSCLLPHWALPGGQFEAKVRLEFNAAR